MNPKPKLVGDLDFVAIEAGLEWKTQQKELQQQQTKAPSQEPDDSPLQPSTSHALANVPKIISVTAKGNSSIAISNAGHVYAWGCNDVGNLGLPKPDPATLTYVDPGQPTTKTSTLRQFHTYSFDSSHNIALPQRLDSISHLHITSVGASPTFLWCLGIPRQEKEGLNIGRTLYEIQETKRRKSLQVHYERILRTVDNGGFAFNKATETTGATLAGSPSSQPDEPQNHPMNETRIKEGSEVDVGEAAFGSAEDLSEEGSTSQHSKILSSAQFSVTMANPESASQTFSATSSPTTPGKKKRMFSAKKLVKAIVRRASGSSSAKESENNKKGIK
jgi:hypothetical protein